MRLFPITVTNFIAKSHPREKKFLVTRSYFMLVFIVSLLLFAYYYKKQIKSLNYENTKQAMKMEQMGRNYFAMSCYGNWEKAYTYTIPFGG